jgi:hypothetical protein
MPGCRHLIHVLIAWVLVVQPAMAAALGAQHVLLDSTVVAACGDADHGLHGPAAIAPGPAGLLPTGAASVEAPSPGPGADHGCGPACHAGAQLPGLPLCVLSVGFRGIPQAVTSYRTTWRSQHRSPPERPPRALA